MIAQLCLRFRHWLIEKNYTIRSCYLLPNFRKCGSRVRFKDIDLLRGPERIEIGTRCSFDKHLFLTAWSQFSIHKESSLIVIGHNCNFGAYNHITAINKVQIGDNCLTGKWVTIDNSLAERSIRPLTVERKNSLFFCSTAGAKASAIFHTIIETCRLLGLSARQYICDFLQAVASGRTDWQNLTPAKLYL